MVCCESLFWDALLSPYNQVECGPGSDNCFVPLHHPHEVKSKQNKAYTLPPMLRVSLHGGGQSLAAWEPPNPLFFVSVERPSQRWTSRQVQVTTDDSRCGDCPYSSQMLARWLILCTIINVRTTNGCLLLSCRCQFYEMSFTIDCLTSYGCGSTRNQGTAGFSICFHLPGFHSGYLGLTHTHMLGCPDAICNSVEKVETPLMTYARGLLCRDE